MDDGAKRRDLEDRTFQFAESVRTFVKQLPRSLSNAEDVRHSPGVWISRCQLDRSRRSPEQERLPTAFENLSQRSKESRLFLRLIDAAATKNTANSRDGLAKEARELTLIFSAIISKSGEL
jgi:hypothetical protein